MVFLVLVILVKIWFWCFWYFWFFGCIKGKRLLCFRVLVTAAPLSIRVDSDVVEEAYLNCPKRSGRV